MPMRAELTANLLMFNFPTFPQTTDLFPVTNYALPILDRGADTLPLISGCYVVTTCHGRSDNTSCICYVI